MQSATRSGGKLVITLSEPVRTLSVRLAALTERASFRAKAKAHADKLTGLKLGVVVRNAKGVKTTVRTVVAVKR